MLVREVRLENFSRGSNLAPDCQTARAVMAGYLEFVTSEPLALCASELDRIVTTKSPPATKLTRQNGLKAQRGCSERKVFLLWYTRSVRA